MHTLLKISDSSGMNECSMINTENDHWEPLNSNGYE